jgi:hypothetical protein
MPFSTEREAKQFLADKICQQSGIDGPMLSDVDRRLLLFSEQDPGSEEGIPEDMLGDVNTEWEVRMTDLLRQAWQRDKADPTECQKYLDALDRLKEGDYYIQVIAGPVFGSLADRAAVGKLGSFLGGSLPTISLRRIALWVAVAMAVMVIIAYLSLRQYAQ